MGRDQIEGFSKEDIQKDISTHAVETLILEKCKPKLQ